MKAKLYLQIVSFVILAAIVFPANATSLDPYSSPRNSSPNTEDARIQQLIHRFEDIKGMDKSDLTRLERKSLRKELKGIKKELKDNGKSKGVYLSVGAIIIIILLLILIL